MAVLTTRLTQGCIRKIANTEILVTLTLLLYQTRRSDLSDLYRSLIQLIQLDPCTTTGLT